MQGQIGSGTRQGRANTGVGLSRSQVMKTSQSSSLEYQPYTGALPGKVLVGKLVWHHQKIGRRSAGDLSRTPGALCALIQVHWGLFPGTQDVSSRSVHAPAGSGGHGLYASCTAWGGGGPLQKRGAYLKTLKIWSSPVLKSRSRSACSSTSASTGSSMSTPGVWPNILSVSTCRACM